MELMTPHIGTMVWTTVTFWVVLFILSKTAWRPILRVLEEREHRIQTLVDKEDEAQKAKENAEQEKKEILQHARQQSADLIAEEKQKAEEMRKKIINRAHEEADKILERANREIEQSRQQVLEQVESIALQVALSATQKLVRTEFSQEMHQQYIRQSMIDMESRH